MLEARSPCRPLLGLLDPLSQRQMLSPEIFIGVLSRRSSQAIQLKQGFQRSCQSRWLAPFVANHSLIQMDHEELMYILKILPSIRPKDGHELKLFHILLRAIPCRVFRLLNYQLGLGHQSITDFVCDHVQGQKAKEEQSVRSGHVDLRFSGCWKSPWMLS